MSELPDSRRRTVKAVLIAFPVFVAAVTCGYLGGWFGDDDARLRAEGSAARPERATEVPVPTFPAAPAPGAPPAPAPAPADAAPGAGPAAERGDLAGGVAAQLAVPAAPPAPS
ncbi:hypothetical protein ACFO4M_18845, partial [Pseudonocardia nematodicida]|uniref:hypothetical protein n=1 Tax=Pseudonocardia nematodicida TaxID=1206997 RepID=UPI003606C752